MKELIRKLLRESFISYPKGLSNVIKRRVSAEELENAFQETKDYIVPNFKKPNHTWYNEGYKNFTRIFVSMIIDDIHYLLHSQLPEDSNWYEGIYQNLYQVYNERIEDIYFNEVKG
mgnify:CR=1 FL=1